MNALNIIIFCCRSYPYDGEILRFREENSGEIVLILMNILLDPKVLILQVLTALAGGLMACAVGSSVALPSSIIPQVIEEKMVPDFDTGSWIGRLTYSVGSAVLFSF